MPTRRTFLSGLGMTGLVAAAFRDDALARAAGASHDAGPCKACELAANEDYWSQIGRRFDNDRSIINFNNGGVCPSPSHVLEQMIRDLRFTNESPARHMWQILEPRVESVRRDLAREFGCDAEEIAVTRNASEAMETLIFGIDLKPGDEVIITDQNYGRMIMSWEQRARRDGIVIKRISFPIPLQVGHGVCRPGARRRSRPRPGSSSSHTSQTCPGRSCRSATSCGWDATRASRCSSTALTPLPTFRSSATTSSATTTAAACTSGCWRRSAPGFSMFARRSKNRSGR